MNTTNYWAIGYEYFTANPDEPNPYHKRREREQYEGYEDAYRAKELEEQQELENNHRNSKVGELTDNCDMTTEQAEQFYAAFMIMSE